MLKGYDGFAGAKLDFPRPAKVRQAYVIASTLRSGSSYFSLALWETGVLGAPWEYLNNEHVRRFMMARLAPATFLDYMEKLAAVRTSRNGVFGVKVHYRDFIATLQGCPSVLQSISPLRFIFIERLDKIAQAVSLARALQTNAWFAFDKQDKMPLVYELDFLEDCLREILAQSNGWKAWFSESGIEPMLVHYEDMIADTPGTVRQVARCLGVENDEPDPVVLPPPIQRQADQVNAEWARRFRQDSELARAWAGNELTAAAQ